MQGREIIQTCVARAPVRVPKGLLEMPLWLDKTTRHPQERFRTSPTAKEIRASSNPDRIIRNQTRQHRKLKQCGNSQSSVAETEFSIIVIGLSGRADTWQSNAKHLYTRVCFSSLSLSPHIHNEAHSSETSTCQQFHHPYDSSLSWPSRNPPMLSVASFQPAWLKTSRKQSHTTGNGTQVAQARAKYFQKHRGMGMSIMRVA